MEGLHVFHPCPLDTSAAARSKRLSLSEAALKASPGSLPFFKGLGSCFTSYGAPQDVVFWVWTLILVAAAESSFWSHPTHLGISVSSQCLSRSVSLGGFQYGGTKATPPTSLPSLAMASPAPPSADPILFFRLGRVRAS